MKILLEAYGCTLNKGEAAELKETLLAGGHDLLENSDKYDTAIIFTCGVIETTQKRMLRRIAELTDSGKRVMVCGCLGAICKEEIRKISPQANMYLPSEYRSVLSDLERDEGIDNKANRIRSGSSVDNVGILPIATGCLGHCTYCVTKQARGVLKSRAITEVRERAERLIEKGAVELQITAQDTGIYGKDIGTTLPDLLNEVTSIDGDFMIRVGMMTPSSAIKNLQDLITAYENRKIFKFLHVPVQSGDDGILKAMGRNYLTSEFLKLVESFRDRFPPMMISTDIIIGFPGETEEDFSRSMNLIEKIRPDIVNVTRFSPRPGTKAYNMKDQIHGRTSKTRSRQLTDLRFKISQSRYSEMIGDELEVLATEYRKPGTTFLRTRTYRPVVIKKVLELGKWYNAKITQAVSTHMIASEV